MTTVAGRRPLAVELLREARPRQWVKNVLVLAAPAAAGILDHWRPLGQALLAFVAFCAAASGTYFMNDLADLEADRRHPTKRTRPIAAGAIDVGVARVVGLSLLLLGIVLGLLTANPKTALIIALYVGLTLGYTLWFKHIAVIDLVAIAGGFILRALAGATAVGVPMSRWFVLCISFGSLFIVTGKRYAELVELGEDAAAVRATLDTYDGPFLRLVLGMACSTTLLTYCLWAFERASLAHHAVPLFELSIVPVVTAVLRYLLVLESGKEGAAPEEVFLRDRPLQALGLVWVALFAAGVYLG
jgi:decaprenyl-phosphate phosphoribosyltransferase